MLAEEDKNAEEKSPLDGRWLPSAFLAWSQGFGGPRVCALACDARGFLFCWEPASQRQALCGSAACEVSRILLRSCGP